MQHIVSFRKAIRVVAYMLRWKACLRSDRNFQSHQVSALELQEAECTLLRADQSFWFSDEIDTLRTKFRVNRKSFMARLDPFLDRFGIIRL